MMKVPIIKIGNSKGILLSKTMLERYHFGEKVELIMQENHLELKPIDTPREGWEDKFRQMHEAGDDKLIIDDLFEDEDMFNDGDMFDDGDLE